MLLLVSFALAGCASSNDTPGTGGPGTGGSDTTSRTGSQSTGPRTTGSTSSGGGGGGGGGGGANHAPTGSISASIETGPVPVVVTFDLKGTDQDNDALTWNLDFDGDGTDKSGTTLPATETYNYTEEGAYTVTFVISDGEAEAKYTLTINATAAVGGGGPVQTITGSWVSGSFGCALYSTVSPGDDEEVFYITAKVPPANVGLPYSAVMASEAGAPAWFSLIFVDADGNIVDGSQINPSPLAPQAPSGTVTYTGEIPDTTDFVFASSCGPGGSIAMDIGA